MAQKECAVCHACGCGTPLYDVAGKLYCGAHRPVVVTASDAQILTPQQRINLSNGR